jgi:hypothetical protein
MPQLPASTSTVAGDDLKFAADESAQAAGNADLLAPVRVSDSRADAPALHRQPRGAAGESDPFADFSRDAEASRRHTTSVDAGEPSQQRPQRWLNEGNGLPQKALLSSERMNDDRATASPSDRPSASGSLEDHPPEQPASEASAKIPGARRALPEAEAVVALDSDSVPASPPAAAAADTRPSSEPRSPSNHAFAWKQAVGRLNALGIRDFQLQPGERDGEFNFSCRFASRSNPRVIHRFEAESGDPLEAVNQVLRQLDDWKARHVDRGQAARTSTTDEKITSRAADSSEVEMTNRSF